MVLALGLVFVLTTAALVAGAVVAVVATHRKAQAAADLAALAGATDLQVGRDPCAAAARIAVANGAEVRRCSVLGDEVAVSVIIALPGALARREVRARARAGPA